MIRVAGTNSKDAVILYISYSNCTIYLLKNEPKLSGDMELKSHYFSLQLLGPGKEKQQSEVRQYWKNLINCF